MPDKEKKRGIYLGFNGRGDDEVSASGRFSCLGGDQTDRVALSKVEKVTLRIMLVFFLISVALLYFMLPYYSIN